MEYSLQNTVLHSAPCFLFLLYKWLNKFTKEQNKITHTHPLPPAPPLSRKFCPLGNPSGDQRSQCHFQPSSTKCPFLHFEWWQHSLVGLLWHIWRAVSHRKSCSSSEISFTGGTKRGFVHCLKNDALNLDLAFQFMLLETGQKWPSVLFSSFQVRQSGILLAFQRDWERTLPSSPYLSFLLHPPHSLKSSLNIYNCAYLTHFSCLGNLGSSDWQ